MILRKHLCTLISRIVQNAGTETTYGHHKTKVDDAWDIKNKKIVDNCGFVHELKGQIFLQ